jgi:hypothetical protein
MSHGLRIFSLSCLLLVPAREYSHCLVSFLPRQFLGLVHKARLLMLPKCVRLQELFLELLSQKSGVHMLSSNRSKFEYKDLGKSV